MAWKYKQRGSEHWWIGYRLHGKQYRRSTGSPDEAVADRELAKLRAMDQAHKAGSLTEEFFRALTNTNAAGDTLRGFADEWLKECRDLSSVTVKKYRDGMDEFCAHVNADAKSPLLRDIRPEAIRSFLRQKRAKTSTATAKSIRKVLRAFFSYAVDSEKLQFNPVQSSKALKLDKDSEAVRRAFTLKELKTIYEKAPSDFWRYMVIAGFYMGQRMGDLITLPWGAVDFEQGFIRLKARKTGASLAIPLRAELRAFLDHERAKAGKVKPSDPIWPEQSARYEQFGAGVFSNEFYDDVLLPAGLVVKRSKHPAKDKNGNKILTQGRQVNPVSFHCLRHTFVSLLKVSGGSQAVAKELAGHSSDAVSDLYTHVPEEVLTAAIAKLPEVTKA
jgi:integrase